MRTPSSSTTIRAGGSSARAAVRENEAFVSARAVNYSLSENLKTKKAPRTGNVGIARLLMPIWLPLQWTS